MKIIIAVCLFFYSVSAQSQDVVDQIITILDLEGLYTETLDEIYVARDDDKELENLYHDSELYFITSERIRKLNALYDKTVSWEAVKPLFKEHFRNGYTKEELDFWLNFLQHPLGKSIQNKDDAYSSALTELKETFLTYVEERSAISQEYSEELNAIIKDRENEYDSP